MPADTYLNIAADQSKVRNMRDYLPAFGEVHSH